jgi:DNA polymerase III subunit delta'
VNGFDSILSQDRPIRTITRFLLKKTIPHALLFTGTEGVGKCLTAMTFAMAANCTGLGIASHQGNAVHGEDGPIRIDACGSCPSCMNIRSRNHPDLIHIEPEGSMIKISQIRDVCRTLAFKPYEARVRFVVISQSHTMNHPAANALLKVLEEPPDRTVLILTAKETADLLPTIVSRCRRIPFSPIAQKDVEHLLVQNTGIEPGDAVIPAAMANGSYTRALLMSRSNWVRKRQWLIEAGGLLNPETLSKRPGSLLLAFSEKLAKNKSTVVDSLEVMKTWLRDLLIYRYTPEKIIHKDLREEIGNISAACTVNGLVKKIEIISRAQKDISAKMNLRLSLDTMMLRLASS